MAPPLTGGRRRHYPPIQLLVAACFLQCVLAHPQPRPHPRPLPPAVGAPTTPVTILSTQDVDSAEARRVLGSSVVTSVSVIADNSTNTRTFPAPTETTFHGPQDTSQGTQRRQGDSKKRPQQAAVGSPAGLMSPDRYEFYTFDETGDLVRRHMTLDEIKSLLAGGDGDMGDTPVATFYHGPVPPPSPHRPHGAHGPHGPHPQGVLGGLEDPEDALEDAVKGVQDVVNNVQNVLKSQLAASKNKLPAYIRPPPQPSQSEAAATWGMILPGIMEGGLPPRPPTSTSSPRPIKTKKPTTTATSKKPAKRPATSTAPSRGEVPPTRLPSTTEQDVVDTLYTLVSSSPGLPGVAVKNTASNNASDPLPIPRPSARPSPTTPPPRPSSQRPPQRPPIPHRPVTSRPATSPHVPQRTKPAVRPTAKPGPSKSATTKPAATKPMSSKPTSSKPKPFKPATPENVQQRRPFPVDDPQQQLQIQQLAESMVQIVTIPRPAPTSTMTPFVTFIPTDVTIAMQHTTPTPTTTVPTTTAPTTPAPTTPAPTTPTPTTPTPTTPLTSRRPPAISYTYRATSTVAPPPTETVSSADLDMDSRTTDDEDISMSTVTETAATLATSPSTASTASAPSTTATSDTSMPPTVWTTSLPASSAARIPVRTSVRIPVRTTTAPRLPPTRTTTTFPTVVTTMFPTTDAPSTATTFDVVDTTLLPVSTTTVAPAPEVKPIRYTEILTRVPASALVTKRVTEDAEPTSTASSTLVPTTERVDEAMAEAVLTTSARPSEVVTTLDESEENVSEEERESAESTETEATTKLYLKISSSETNGMIYMTSPSTSTSTEASAETSAETVTATVDSDTRTTVESSWETTAVTDQSAASTEQRGTTASTTALPTISTEAAESRTEAMVELDTTEVAVPSTVAPPSSPSTSAPTTETETTSVTTGTSTSSAAPTSSSSAPVAPEYLSSPELSLESSNIQASLVDAPQSSGLKMASTTSAPTSPALDVEANKVETEATPSTLQSLWTRLPIVNSAEDDSASAHGDGHPHGLPHGPGAVKASEEDAVRDAVKTAVYQQQPSSVELHAAPHEHLGLEAVTASLDPDVGSFVNLCNELAFQMWMAVKERAASTTMRSLVMSPFAATSTLAMVFLGARGPTSGQMNDVLRLDDMVSFNPHQVMWNVTEALTRPRTKNSGVATAALVRELYSDKNKGKLLDFYKERAQQFYDGHVEEITFRNSGDLVRRKTNLLVKRQTRGRVQEYMRGASLALRGPLAAFGANIFETDCTGASTDGRDGEMHFVVVPSSRQRRLVPVPAAVWRSGFLAGYDPALDATAVAMGPADAAFSTVLVLPGQQGHVAPGDGLSRLEQRLLESRGPGARWARLLRTLLPRPGLELQVPRFSHRSVLNMSEALQRMGLDELFSSEHADLRGLNGVANDLHLSDVVQLNTFSTCGERAVDSRHHVEFYPTSPLASPGRRAARGRRLRPRVAEADDPSIELHPDNVGKDRDAYYARLGDALEAAEARGSSGLTSSEEATVADDQDSSSSASSSASAESQRESHARTFQRIADFEDPDLMKVPLALRPRQARIPEAARLRFDRPFLFFVRHNPTGVLLTMGRFNPRLLP